jgi:hypothetical protein
VRGPSGIFPAPYCSGLGYWLSRRACQIISHSELTGDTAEDRWVGNALLSKGIRPVHDGRYAVITSQRNAKTADEGPRQGYDIIAACEFTPQMMREVHRQWLEFPVE